MSYRLGTAYRRAMVTQAPSRKTKAQTVRTSHDLKSRRDPDLKSRRDPDDDEEYDTNSVLTVERDPAPERKDHSFGGWAPLLIGGSLLVGLAWYVSRQGQTKEPPQLPPASEPYTADEHIETSLNTNDSWAKGKVAQADAWSEAIRKAAEAANNQPASTNTVNYLSDPIALETGARYRAVLTLSGFEAMANADMLAAKFTDLGFTNVKVAMNAGELPSDWPKETLAGTTSKSRFLEGNWGRANFAMDKPPQIERAWRA